MKVGYQQNYTYAIGWQESYQVESDPPRCARYYQVVDSTAIWVVLPEDCVEEERL